MIFIPPRETRRLTQTNRSDILGDLWSTFGIDLRSNVGAVRLGQKMKVNTKTGDTDASNLGLPAAFQFFDGYVFALAGTRIFKNTGANVTSVFAEDGSTGARTDYADNSDMLLFNGTLVATTASELYSKATDGSGTGAWTDRNAGLASSSSLHKLVYFTKFDRLYISDNRNVNSVDTSWNVASSAGDYFINLGGGDIGAISTMAATSDSIFIGMRTSDGIGNALGQCSVFEWDGISSQVTREYKVNASSVMAMVVKDDRPYILDSNGILSEFTGYSFKEIGRLPVELRGYLGDPFDADFDDHYVHPNGLISHPDGTFLALICNRNLYLKGTTENSFENLASGIWEWSPENGFVHKHPLTYTPIDSSTITDHGQNRISKAGGLSNAKLATNSSSGVGTLICGAEYYTDASTSKSAIFVDAPFPSDNSGTPEGKKYGYLVSTWITAEQLEDDWSRVVATYNRLLDSSDRIWLKYRTYKEESTDISITWATTSSFTTSTDLSGYVGQEVEVIQGTGSGKCAHIVSVSGSGTYTVTLDEVYDGVSGTALARVQDWKKYHGSVSDQTSDYKIFTRTVNSRRIQLKICLQFTGDGEFYELAIMNKPHSLMV